MATNSALVAHILKFVDYPVADSDLETSASVDREPEIADLEKRIGFRLPADYREFLRGMPVLPYGVLARNRSEPGEVSMGIFCAPTSWTRNILESTRSLPRSLRSKLLVIGEVYEGDELCLRVVKGADEGVAVLRDGAPCVIASSFRKFVEGLDGSPRFHRSEEELRSAGQLLDFVAPKRSATPAARRSKKTKARTSKKTKAGRKKSR